MTPRHGYHRCKHASAALMAVERADDTPEDRNWLGQLADEAYESSAIASYLHTHYVAWRDGMPYPEPPRHSYPDGDPDEYTMFQPTTFRIEHCYTTHWMGFSLQRTLCFAGEIKSYRVVEQCYDADGCAFRNHIGEINLNDDLTWSLILFGRCFHPRGDGDDSELVFDYLDMDEYAALKLLTTTYKLERAQ